MINNPLLKVGHPVALILTSENENGEVQRVVFCWDYRTQEELDEAILDAIDKFIPLEPTIKIIQMNRIYDLIHRTRAPIQTEYCDHCSHCSGDECKVGLNPVDHIYCVDNDDYYEMICPQFDVSTDTLQRIYEYYQEEQNKYMDKMKNSEINGIRFILPQDIHYVADCFNKSVNICTLMNTLSIERNQK